MNNRSSSTIYVHFKSYQFQYHKRLHRIQFKVFLTRSQCFSNYESGCTVGRYAFTNLVAELRGQRGLQPPPAKSFKKFNPKMQPVFPISAKKCEKCEIFSGIFALKFCEFPRFFSRQKPAFLFPAKNRRQPRFTAFRSGMSQKSRRKVGELRRRTFFFLEINIKSEKKMPPSA